MTTAEIERYLVSLLDESAAKGASAVEIVSGKIHKILGLDSRMPMVCNAMKKINKYEKEIIHETASGFSSTLRIKYVF